MTLTCTFEGCDQPGQEYCIDCLVEGAEGLAIHCDYDYDAGNDHCVTCTCDDHSHEEGFVSCSLAHTRAQMGPTPWLQMGAS